jgi:hypothetical protein
MWANHDWMDIHPAKLNGNSSTLYRAASVSSTFDKMTDHIVSKYFSHPSYWKIDGCPYLSIYELYRLVQGSAVGLNGRGTAIIPGQDQGCGFS